MSPPATFDCPRRADMLLWGAGNEKWGDHIDAMLDPEGHPVYTDAGEVIPPQDHWRIDGTCCYCGSMSPEALFEAIACGAELGPTDKNYKVYVQGGDQIVQGGARKSFGGKFYTVHLNRKNASRLRALLMEGRVKVGYPGHFYAGLWLAPPQEDASTEQE